VAWALLQLHQVDPNEKWETVALANLEWALSKQRKTSRLYDECAFEPGLAPFTHTIAYAIRGLWESGLILNDERYLKSATGAAKAVIQHLRQDGHLPGQISPDNQAAAKYCCLTGNAQLAIIWAKMFQRTGDARFRQAATKALLYVMKSQKLTNTDLNRCGAIKGSEPVWGRYAPLTYPNWATKFFVDALLICREWLR
jgi:uncharacterized protein YyaL (SSP411 family)